MSDNPAQMRARAETEQAAADSSTLTNVRERCVRSAKAWNKMADQAERTQTLRRAREAAVVPRLAD